MTGLRPGLAAEIVHIVTDADTAAAVGSGDVPVLATPRLLALAEAATVAAIGSVLSPGQTSVGARVVLEHSAPSPVGTRVSVRAELVAVEGRSVSFDVAAEHDDGRIAGRGRITRVVVDRTRFPPRSPS